MDNDIPVTIKTIEYSLASNFYSYTLGQKFKDTFKVTNILFSDIAGAWIVMLIDSENNYKKVEIRVRDVVITYE